MAKDPAILFYWNDWIGGTATLSRYQKGCYMDLLAAQFNSGPLTLEQIKTVLGQDQAAWTVLSSKFKKVAEPGAELYFNERLETERRKRKVFTDSRRNNLQGKKNLPDGQAGKLPLMKPHMENENINENKIKNKNIGIAFGKPMATEGGAGGTSAKAMVPDRETSTAEEVLTSTEIFTAQVQNNEDPVFMVMFLNKFPGKEIPAVAVTGHENKNFNTEWRNQNHFRKSLLQYITSYLQNQHNGNTYHKAGAGTGLTQSTSGTDYTDNVL